MPNGHPLKTRVKREPFSELGRNEFLEFLDNLLRYAIKQGKMSESKASEIYLSYEEYVFPEVYDPITGNMVADPEGTGQYLDPKKLPAWNVIKQFTPEAMTKREGREAEYGQYLKDFGTWHEQWAENVALRRQAELGASQQRAYGVVRGLGGEQEEPKMTPGYPAGPPLEKTMHPFLEKMPHTMQQYWSPGRVWSAFGRQQPNVYEAWLKAIQPYEVGRRPKTARQYAEQAERFGAMGAGLPELPTGYESYYEARKAGVPGMPSGMEEQASMAALYGAQAAEKMVGKLGAMTPGERRERREMPPTPMEEWQGKYGAGSFEEYMTGWMEKYPFLSEFAELPPERRGYYPRKYRPPTRWLG